MGWYEQVPNLSYVRIYSLNISSLVIDRLYTDIKITYNTKMIHIMVFFSDYHNSIFIESVPYEPKNWQLHGILQIFVEISIFSPHVQNFVFSAYKNEK